MYKIGWFSTGNGEAARDLLKTVWQAIKERKIPRVEISFVFCNRKYGESAETDKFLDLVKSYNLPIISWSSRTFKPKLRQSNLEKWREEYDRIVMSFLAVHPADIYFLAGYMLITSPLMCKNNHIFNLHPAKPGGPKGTWQEVIQQLIKNKEKESGVMIHLVTPELDEGPPITYCKYKIKEYDFNKIRRQGLVREFPLIVETLKLLAKGKIKIKKKKKPRNLTRIINKRIRFRS